MDRVCARSGNGNSRYRMADEEPHLVHRQMSLCFWLGVTPRHLSELLEIQERGSETCAIEGGCEISGIDRKWQGVLSPTDYVCGVPLRLNELAANSIFRARNETSNGLECVGNGIPH